jgi:Phosphotransferase enzyme family
LKESVEMNVLASACERGVVTRREIESGLVSVHVAADAPRVRSILVRGHAIAFVKRPRLGGIHDLGDGGLGSGRVGAEWQALSRAGAADLGPRLLCGADDGLLWLSALPGRRLVSARQLTGAGIAELADICQGWGAAVAALHREPAPKSGRPAAQRPTLPRTARASGVDSGRIGVPSGGHADQVLQAIETDRALVRAVAAVDEGWSDRHWIHGELTAEHVIIDPWPTLQVRFVGFGRAGLGDPDWDLAGCLDTIAGLVDPVVSGVGARTARSRAQESMLGDYFLHAYRRAGGPGRVHPAMRATYALSAAWRLASEQPAADPGCARLEVLRHLERAREFASFGAAETLAA